MVILALLDVNSLKFDDVAALRALEFAGSVAVYARLVFHQTLQVFGGAGGFLPPLALVTG
jgi:hypothetical protein